MVNHANNLPDAFVSGTRWPVLLGVWGVYFSFGVISTSMASLLSSIRADIGVNNAVMGLILGAWPISYILCEIPFGLLLNRLCPRRLLAISIMVMAASAFARCGAETPLQLFLQLRCLEQGDQ